MRSWVDLAEDATGNPAAPDGWQSREAAAERLAPLFAEIGATYARFSQANTQAFEDQRTLVELEIDGRPWRQPAFRYQAKCLQEILGAFDRLQASDKSWVSKVLSGTGCEVFTRC